VRCFITATCLAAPGVFVLSREFVTSEWPMAELQRFLERWNADHSCVSLIPVFLGLTVKECAGLSELYKDNTIWEGRERPAEGVLETWSAAVRLLCSFIGVEPKTVSAGQGSRGTIYHSLPPELTAICRAAV
jgi:hypothetical protein